MERYPFHTSIVLAWCVLTLVVMGSPSAQAQHTLRYQETGPLDLVMTGNTLGLSKQFNLNGPGTEDSIGTFIAADPTATDDNPANVSNPWFVGTTNSWSQNGSSAELILPANASVVYAELLWGGSYDYLENVSVNLDDPITLSSPGGSQLVTPDPTAAATLQLMASTGFMVNYYTRSAVVTSFVSTHHAATYSVAGVPATQAAQINNLNAAGWTLVVVYETPDGPIRDVSVFSGAAWIEDGSPTDVVTTNLCAPETGPVSGKLAVSAIDGDCDRVGDQFQIAPDSSPFVALSGPNNPVDNFFASQINGGDGLMDTLGTFGSLNHDAAGGNNVIGARQGWDLTTVALSSANGHLINSQNTATLRGSTLSGGDGYVLTALALVTDTHAPRFELQGASWVSTTQADVHHEVTYTVTLDNFLGVADAFNVQFYQPLPTGMTLVDFAVDGVPGDGGGNPVTNADLTSGVDIGTVARNTSMTIEVTVRVEDLPAAPDPASFTTEASWNYAFQPCAGGQIFNNLAVTDPITVTVPRLGLALSTQPSDDVVVGETLDLNVSVQNTGLAATADAALQITLPLGLTYVPGSTEINAVVVPDVAGAHPFAVSQTVASAGQPAGTVAAGESVTVTLQAEVSTDATTTITWSATVDSDGNGPSPALVDSLSVNVTSAVAPDAGAGDAGPGDDAGPSEDAGPGDDAGPGEDAGTGDAGTGDAGPGEDAGTDVKDDDGGCGCRSTGSDATGGFLVLLLLLGWCGRRLRWQQ